MAQHQTKLKNALDAVDPVWTRIRQEAEDVVRREPELASFIYASVLRHDTLEGAVVHRLAERLNHADVSGEAIRQAYADALEDDQSIGDAFRADVVATVDRDPAADRYLEPVLYFKGFHAIQTHRLAHWLFKRGRKDFAYYLQVGRRACSRPTSIPRCASVAAFSSITRPGWSLARRRRSTTTSRSCRT